jgi:hypothetical protein
VDDVQLVRSFESFRNLPGDRQRLLERDGALGDAVSKGDTLHHLHDESLETVALFEAVDVRDVGMIECGESLRLTLEAGDSLAIGRE